MNLFRVFARLRALEEADARHVAAFMLIPQAMRQTIVDLITAERIETAEHVGRRIEEHKRESTPCARCGSIVDLRMRESGPRAMQRGVDGDAKTIIACNECIPAVKRAGWSLAKITAAPTEPAKEQEAPS